VLDPLLLKGVSYLFAGFLALTALILSLVSLGKELISEKPVHGGFSLALILAAFCAVISLISTYVPIEQGNAKKVAFSSNQSYGEEPIRHD
jgi:hypothetical protein